MQIVIDISEEDYRIMRHNVAIDNPLCPIGQKEMVTKIANGIPLSKGHGRLIDESKIKKCGWNFLGHHAKTDAPTIIEADEIGLSNQYDSDLEAIQNVPSAQPEQAIKDCRNCKYGRYNDYHKTMFCYNSDDCIDWNLWEPAEFPSELRCGYEN